MEWIILTVIAFIILLAIIIYNRLVSLRVNRNNAFANIDTQLRLRYDLLPNLVKTVKGYAKHESAVLTELTNARTNISRSSSLGDRIESEQKLSSAMMNLFAVAKNYPDLKADKNFAQLQTELSDIENKIAAARRFFNSATGEYNAAIQQFPAVLIAGTLGFQKASFFEIDTANRDTVTETPSVDF